MIKAIVFDCFGVLTTDGWLPFKRKYFSHDPKLLAEATDLNKQTDAGLASYEEFAHRIAELANVSYADVNKAIEGNVTDDELLEYIAAELKPHYKIGMLSNAGADWLERLFTDDQRNIFDAVALSYETGTIKPQPEAYQIIADRLAVTRAECIFVDDQERYCTAAREQGMQAVWYRNFEQFKQEIDALLAR
jgi:HAD superfamily hydrolase (TIGR01509 family)